MLADLKERGGLYLQENRFVRGGASLALAFVVSLALSQATFVQSVAGALLREMTEIKVSYGNLVPDNLKNAKLQRSSVTFPLPCTVPSAPSACSGTAEVAVGTRGVVASVFVTLLLFFLAVFNVVISIYSARPRSLIRGESLLMEIDIGADETTTNKMVYKGVRSISGGASPSIPVDLDFFFPTRAGCSDEVSITELRVQSHGKRPVDLSPKFAKTPYYKGLVTSAGGGDEPLHFEMIYKVSKNFAISLKNLQNRWNDESANQQKDSISWSSRANWAKVTIKINMPDIMSNALDGHPWVTWRKTEGAHHSPLKNSKRHSWNEAERVLVLQDVGPGQMFTICWKFRDIGAPGDSAA